MSTTIKIILAITLLIVGLGATAVRDALATPTCALIYSCVTPDCPLSVSGTFTSQYDGFCYIGFVTMDNQYLSTGNFGYTNFGCNTPHGFSLYPGYKARVVDGVSWRLWEYQPGCYNFRHITVWEYRAGQ